MRRTGEVERVINRVIPITVTTLLIQRIFRF